ncbi:MAG: tRNA (guanosine(37)-N1)-methyltransferase TrmD [Candidatus Sumerlaeia bacterium]|nr:tRNA (guanosine(37)-N1)-methyltransferase TrmD [Candidatus Sumerlaeia bacterium]
MTSSATPRRYAVLTVLPSWFDGPYDDGILFRAQEKGLVELPVHNLKDYAPGGSHHNVDDYPFGGGAGQLFKPEPLAAALDALAGPPGTPNRPRVLYTSPKGRTWNQQLAKDYLVQYPNLLIICGRYEGIDQRIIDSRVDEEISLGDFVMTGGEITALALIDSLVRLIPGVLGKTASYEHDSFYEGLLEAPHYTRPAEFEGMSVPKVLLSGNHTAIQEWREEQALLTTLRHRPDLLTPGQRARALKLSRRGH